MRDAESAFDQVISFAGGEVTADAVAEVLGLVGRDLLFDILTAVADEDAAQAFALAGRAVEAGYDLRILCREIAALVRAMMLVSIDPSRLTDPDLVLESDRDRLKALTARFSREDLLRSFDLLAKAEQDVRAASQPRYALEMALVKWIHLRKLVPISELIAGLDSGAKGATGAKGAGGASSGAFGASAATSAPMARRQSLTARTPFAPKPSAPVAPKAAAGQRTFAPSAPTAPHAPAPRPVRFRPTSRNAFSPRFSGRTARSTRCTSHKRSGSRWTRAASSSRSVRVHETMRQQVEQRRQWLESLAESVAGGKVTVATARGRATRAGSRGRHRRRLRHPAPAQLTPLRRTSLT